MTFLLVITFLMYIHGFSMVRIARRSGKSTRERWLILAHFLVIQCGGVAFLIGIGLLEIPGDGVNMDIFSWCVPMFLAFALLNTAIFGVKFIRMAKTKNDPTPAGWRSGLSLLAVLAGLYVVFTVSDHYWFFRDAKDNNAGVAAAEALGGDDVKCGTGMVLVRVEPQGARYRCPESIAYGARQSSNQPFVPWPSYREGVSMKLKAGIEDALKTAK